MPERIEVPDEFPPVGNVSGKRIVLTGAGRGLGELIAHALSRGGAKVALVARTPQDLADVAAKLTGPTLQFAGDVRDPLFNGEVADKTVAAWGGLDVWISNAGISPLVAGPLETSPEVWREVIDVNLNGAFFGARAAARVMRPGGRIIFTGSVLGERPSRGLAAYSASKAGLVGMAKALALDLAPLKINVNVVAPGWFESPLAGPWMRRDDRSKTVLDHTALNRWGRPAELAGAFQFLASDAAEFVTGTVLNVDGGYLLA
ncbi:MAG TPA: SDR family oxidoreductase [Trebonia sp.]|jgi:NAD(P)-dependent dehydrogenase (short-subunit alcohol dehydrogenase family)